MAKKMRQRIKHEMKNMQMELVRDHVARLQAEVDTWRARYPASVIYVREEARAKVEGRAPNYPPPIAVV